MPSIRLAAAGLSLIAASPAAAATSPGPPPLRVNAQGQHLILEATSFCWASADQAAMLCADGRTVDCSARRAPRIRLSRGRRVAVRLGFGFVPRQVSVQTFGPAGEVTSARRVTPSASPRVVLAPDAREVGVFTLPKGQSGDAFYMFCVDRR